MLSVTIKFIRLNVIILNVIILNVFMLNAIMLNVFMLNAIMLNVVAPLKTVCLCVLVMMSLIGMVSRQRC